MFSFFKRKPDPSEAARALAQRGQDKRRASYQTFHDEMAAKAGTVIKWAK